MKLLYTYRGIEIKETKNANLLPWACFLVYLSAYIEEHLQLFFLKIIIKALLSFYINCFLIHLMKYLNVVEIIYLLN